MSEMKLGRNLSIFPCLMANHMEYPIHTVSDLLLHYVFEKLPGFKCKERGTQRSSPSSACFLGNLFLLRSLQLPCQRGTRCICGGAQSLLCTCAGPGTSISIVEVSGTSSLSAICD